MCFRTGKNSVLHHYIRVTNSNQQMKCSGWMTFSKITKRELKLIHVSCLLFTFSMLKYHCTTKNGEIRGGRVEFRGWRWQLWWSRRLWHILPGLKYVPAQSKYVIYMNCRKCWNNTATIPPSTQVWCMHYS